MAPNTRNRQNTADPEHQDNSGETGGEPMPGTGNTASTNTGSIAGFSAEQSSSMHSQIAAQITANNKVLLDQMRAMMKEMMDARFGPEQHQVSAPINPRFVNTPTPEPSSEQPHLHSNPLQSNPLQSNQQPNPSQSSHHNTQTPLANDTATTRWRGEELGTFDPAVDDVYTFTNRMHQVAELRGHLLVQLNVSLQLRGLAKNWYEMELDDSGKTMLSDARTIRTWVNALIQRFRPAAADMLHQLEQTHYTRADAAMKKDPVAFLHEILRLTRHDNRPDHERLTIAYIHFESQLRISLIAPRYDTSISEFIEQLEGKKHAWYESYHYFKKKDYLPLETAPNQYSNDERAPQRQQWPRNNTQQQWPRSNAQQQWPRNSAPPPNTAPPQRLLPAPPGAKAYFVDPNEEDWQYDAPTDSYHAYPTAHGPGHTPRRFGNTNDNGGTEAMANWASAGEDHRCNQEGCTHYH